MGIYLKWKCPYTISYFQLWTYNSQNLLFLEVKMPGFFSSWPTLAGPGVTWESVQNSNHRISEGSKHGTQCLPCFQSCEWYFRGLFCYLTRRLMCVLKQSVTPPPFTVLWKVYWYKSMKSDIIKLPLMNFSDIFQSRFRNDDFVE